MTYWYHGPNADLVDEARSYLGVRWKHQGRSREGVDCIGLPIVIARDKRGFTYDTRDYDRVTPDAMMLHTCSKLLTKIPTAEMRPGDIAIVGEKNLHHMVIIGDYKLRPHERLLSMIHAHLRDDVKGKVEEHRMDSVWRGRIRSVYRYPEHK